MHPQEVNIVILGLFIAAISTLGFIVFFNNPKSATNRAFLHFALSGIVWSLMNFTSYVVVSPGLDLWLWRLVLFTALWFCWSIFHFSLVFPYEKMPDARKFPTLLFYGVSVVSLLTLTPYVFVRLKDLPAVGTIPSIENGPLIPLFGITIIGLIVGTIRTFLQTRKKGTKLQQEQIDFVMTGTAITFALLIIFNFVLPTMYQLFAFIPYGVLFIFPFIAFSAYAIFRYRLFNVKLLATELFSFLLAVIALSQIFFSHTFQELVFRIGTFFAVVIVSVLLVQSIIREVRQRELIEVQEKELEESNARLRELDTQKSEFLSFASHQLRTPLTAIKWSAGALLDHAYGEVPTHLQEPIQSIFDESSLMAVLVNDYLNVSRIEQGKMQYQFAPADLAVVLAGVAKQLEPSLRGKGLKLSSDFGRERAMVWGDTGKLTQIFGNIIDNAMKYTPKGEIKVLLKRLPERGIARVEIRDTGIGMDDATRGKIFDKFVRGANATEVNNGGSGLGLFIVKTFVEAHKGKIWAESDGVDKGTVFIVELPLLIQK